MGPLATLSCHLEGLTPLTPVATHRGGFKFTQKAILILVGSVLVHPAKDLLLNYSLLVVWAEQHAKFTDFCPRPARKETNVPLNKRS